jgi:nonsense-mediated mRNA decay protein 3
MKFCFVCGKKTEKLIEGYCEDCYNNSFNLIQTPKEITILLCSKCKKIKQKNDWNDIGIEDLVKNNIKVLGDNVKIEVIGNKIFASGSLKNSKKFKEEETHEINIKTVKVLCPECSRRLGGYYEAIMQLRGNVSEEVLNFIDKEIKEKSFYRIDHVKGGFILYIGNKNIANQIADKIKRIYNLEVKKSFKLYTKKEGKDVYKSVFSVKCD